MTGHAYWWLQDGFSLSDSALMASAEQFENHTYPTTRAYFGSEWSPGIDGDARIHVVMGNIPGVGGYYASSNEYSRLADPYSNQLPMLATAWKRMSTPTPFTATTPFTSTEMETPSGCSALTVILARFFCTPGTATCLRCVKNKD
jgi:hypothetical protein